MFHVFARATLYASTGTGFMALCLSVCVCHKSVLYGWTNRACFGHGSFFPPIVHCVVRKFRYHQNKILPSGILLSQTPVYRSSSKRVIDLARQKGGHSERDKLDCQSVDSTSELRQSTVSLSHYPPSSVSTRFRRASLLETADTCTCPCSRSFLLMSLMPASRPTCTGVQESWIRSWCLRGSEPKPLICRHNPFIGLGFFQGHLFLCISMNRFVLLWL